MKRKWTLFTAGLLTLSLLAGCAAGNPAPQASVTESTAAETTVPETTVPETTVPVTEAPTEAFQVTVRPVISGAQAQVHVSTADEFLAAIAPDTEIILDAALIDLSEATGYGEGEGEYYYWHEEFDGPELYITGVSNLTIRGGGNDRTANVLSAVPRYADVLSFENCSNIYVTGFTAGHTKEPGSCAGGVLHFWNSQDILVENCGLYGCGIVGVQGDSSRNMQIIGNDIYECSTGGVYFSNCDDVNVDGNTFRDLGGPDFRVYGCGTITCNGEKVHDHSPRF